MIYVVDACALLNLANGQMLDSVLSLPESAFCFGSAVHEEIPTLSNDLEQYLATGSVKLLDDSLFSAQEFLSIKDSFRLGDGETECLIAARYLGGMLVCDDQAARRAAIGFLGEKRVTGTIGLLRLCVAQGLVDRSNAFTSFQLMKAMGGFLPELAIDEMFP